MRNYISGHPNATEWHLQKVDSYYREYINSKKDRYFKQLAEMTNQLVYRNDWSKGYSSITKKVEIILRKANFERKSRELTREARQKGKGVLKVGVVFRADGTFLRKHPDSNEKREYLPLGKRVFIEFEWTHDRKVYYYVRTRQVKKNNKVIKKSEEGFVRKRHIANRIPEPKAKLHPIEANENAWDLIARKYPDRADKWGEDRAFYINVLVYANKGTAGESGIYKKGGNNWKNTILKQGKVIWIPSNAYALALKGMLPSGSRSYNLYSYLKEKTGIDIEGAFTATAFTSGLLYGVGKSVWDLLRGIVDLISLTGKIIYSIVSLNILNDISNLYKSIKQTNFGDLINEIWDDHKTNWNHPNILRKWFYRGTIIGYIIAEIALIILTWGAGTTVKLTGKLGQFIQKITKLRVVQKIIPKANKASKTIGKTQVKQLKNVVKEYKKPELDKTFKRRVVKDKKDPTKRKFDPKNFPDKSKNNKVTNPPDKKKRKRNYPERSTVLS